MNPAPALEMVDVVKEFPGAPPVRAIDGIDLTVQRGELTALVAACAWT